MNGNRLFQLRIRFARVNIAITAWDGGFQAPNHNRINVGVTVNGRRVFAPGELYCGLTQGHAIDGRHARELVMSLVAMRPGDTDSEYFENYTPAQLGFAYRYGEGIEAERQARYCDQVRS